jgi:hypothetical protein
MLRRIVRSAVASLALISMTTTLALADPNTPTDPGVNPGVRIGDWIYRNVTALFAPLLAVVAIYYLAKRQFTQFLSFAVFAVIAALFIFAGADFKDAAVGLVKWIIGK